MKILQIGPLPPEVGGRTTGGVATHVWHLSKNLAERGHEVAVFASNFLSTSVRPNVNCGVRIYGKRRPLYTIQSSHLLSPHFWSKIFQTKRHFGPLQSWSRVLQRLLDHERVIRSFRPDLIHVHPLELRFPYAHFTIGGKIPLIASIHSTHFVEFSDPSVRPLRYHLVKEDLAAVQNLIFVSQYVRKQVETLFPAGLEKKKIWVVHNPIDGSLFSPIPREEACTVLKHPVGDPLILFVGSLIPRKATHLLIEAFSEVRKQHPRARLMIVGDGPQRGELEKRIQEKDLIGFVSMEGPKSQADLRYYYSAANLFVLPSLMESFGLVFVEAMLCGCPVIGTPGALKEILPSDENGFYIPPGDIRALMTGIQRALEQSWNREKIRQSVLHFDWRESLHRFERIYNEICDSFPGRGVHS